MLEAPNVNALVVYATKHGSTEEVARVIAERLRQAGVSVDVAAARDVRAEVSGYSLVVLGGAIYAGRWHRDAHVFLKRHREQLESLRVAVFGMGPRETTDDAFERAAGQLRRALAKRSWLAPVSTAIFGGVDPPLRSERKARRDARNWTVIADWASSLVARARTAA